MQKTGSNTQLLGPGSRQATADGEASPATRRSPAAPPPLPLHRRTGSTSGAAGGGGDAAALGPLLTPGSRRPSSSGGVVPQRQQVEQELIYEKLPADIAERYVLLMDPILGSGNSAARAIQVRRQGLDLAWPAARPPLLRPVLCAACRQSTEQPAV